MSFAEDLTPFFSDFGEAGTLAGQAVRVIFDAPVDQLAAAPGMAAAQPQVQIASASVPADVEGLSLTLARGAYVVREHVADGTGMSLLMLSLAA